MVDLVLGFRKWLSGAQPWRVAQTLLRPGGIFIFFLILVAGINAITGSQKGIQAAASLDKRSPDASNLPYTFQFVGQGRITAGAEGVWVIGGIPIQVDERTQLTSTLHVGDFVSLSGRIADSDVWFADRIEPGKAESPNYTFNGPLEWVRGSLWRIGGHSLLVNSGTELGRDLAASDILLATFTVLEGGAWQALEIKAFDPSMFEPTPTSSPTLTPTEKAQDADSTATVVPASAEVSAGKEDGPIDQGDDDDDDDKDGKRDDKDKDKRDDQEEGDRKDDRDDDDRGDEDRDDGRDDDREDDRDDKDED